MSQAPLLIGGINRSGTSLTRSLLGSHPDVAIPPTEFGFFDNPSVKAGWRNPRADFAGIAEKILEGQKLQAWGLDAAAVLERTKSARSMRDVFTSFLDEYARALNKPRWGEKTTHYERHLSTFDTWFGSDYTFVHVIRHPVAVFASTRHYPGEQAFDARTWAWTWTRSAVFALRALRHPLRRNHLVVRYEDMVRDPEAVLRHICGRTGLDYDARMLEMSDFEQHDNSSFAPADSTYRGLIRVADAIQRADQVSADEIRQIRSICGSTARLLGYALQDEHFLSSVSTRRQITIGLDTRYVAFRARSRVRQRIGRDRGAVTVGVPVR